MTEPGFRRTLVLLLVAAMSGFPAVRAADADGDHAVILLYHHVSEDTPASTSVSPAVFDAHLDYLAENGYTVLPLAEVVSALREKRPLPPQSAAITFDDGYESVLTEAMPRLAARGWPFAVFVSTDAIDRGFGGFMDWDGLRRIESAGGVIGNHTASHDHLVRRRPGESRNAWRQRVSADIRKAESRLAGELDLPVKLLAWPYGEFDEELEQLAVQLGHYAFGQQSGPAGQVSDFQALPRFPMASGFAALDGFAEKLRSRPLPVSVLAPGSRILAAPARPPALAMRIAPGRFRSSELRCYVTGQDPAAIERRDDRFDVTALAPLRPGRGKFNCTAPSSDESGVFYWYSHLWLQPNDDGSWYEE